MHTSPPGSNGRTALLSPLFAGLLALAACGGSTPMLEAQVVDIWDQPIDGVEIAIDGITDPLKSNAEGRASFPKPDGEVHAKASKSGYLPADAAGAPEDDKPFVIRMTPEPSSDGFHVIGREKLTPLPAQAVVSRVSALDTIVGVETVGDIEAPGRPFTLIFHTPLRMDEVSRLGIELHRLKFVEKAQVETTDGQTEVPLSLWVSDGEIAFEKTPLGSDDNYFFQVDSLPSGTYAFVSMELLTPRTTEGFAQIPEPVRKVHTFTVN